MENKKVLLPIKKYNHFPTSLASFIIVQPRMVWISNEWRGKGCRCSNLNRKRMMEKRMERSRNKQMMMLTMMKDMNRNKYQGRESNKKEEKLEVFDKKKILLKRTSPAPTLAVACICSSDKNRWCLWVCSVQTSVLKNKLRRIRLLKLE